MYKNYKNNHLVEVNCGFHFLDDSSNWDSTYFGQFYELIKSNGFNEKLERKGIQVTIKDDKNSTSSKIASQEVEEQVIFKNSTNGLAILIAKNRISFHSVGNYTNWHSFSNDFILPNLEKYISLGLGKGNYRLNVLYLNKFQINIHSKTSDYLTFYNEIENFANIQEIDNNFRRVFKSNDLTLLIRGNRTQNINNSIITFECGSFLDSQNLNVENLTDTLNLAHKPIRDLFENSITEKLKATL